MDFWRNIRVLLNGVPIDLLPNRLIAIARSDFDHRRMGTRSVVPVPTVKLRHHPSWDGLSFSMSSESLMPEDSFD